MDTFLATLFLIICGLLIVVVLLQKGRGGGMGGLFGGAGSSAFGTRTGDVFTWVTIILVAFFILLAVGVNLWFRPPKADVSTPTFLPRQGAITDHVLVSLQCDTPGADIYYTVDGVEPTRRSQKFEDTGPFRVEPGWTVKARAFRSDWNPSQIAVAEYPLEKAEPAPPPDTRPAGTQPAGGAPPASRPASAPAP